VETWFEILKAALDQKQRIALATVIHGPMYVGNKMIIYVDKTTYGTLGSCMLDQLVIGDAMRTVWQSDAYLHTYSLLNSDSSYMHFEVFIDGYAPPPELLIIGANHIAIALTTFAKQLSYQVTIIDPRAAFATHERFPHADEVLIAWPDSILKQRELTPATAVVILTHDPKIDDPALQIALTHSVGYIGVLGSRKTNIKRYDRLKNAEITDEQFHRIHAPVGLAIGATTPEEIALAIMAEIIAVRRGMRNGQRQIDDDKINRKE
jgi:xanthine dehydrogenase accessory factor